MVVLEARKERRTTTATQTREQYLRTTSKRGSKGRYKYMVTHEEEENNVPNPDSATTKRQRSERKGEIWRKERNAPSIPDVTA